MFNIKQGSWIFLRATEEARMKKLIKILKTKRDMPFLELLDKFNYNNGRKESNYFETPMIRTILMLLVASGIVYVKERMLKRQYRMYASRIYGLNKNWGKRLEWCLTHKYNAWRTKTKELNSGLY